MLRFDFRDLLGIALVAGAVGVLLVHEGDDHQAVHLDATTQAPGNARVSETEAARGVTVFSDFTIADQDGRRIADHQVVVVRDGEIAWIGPSDGAAIPQGARILHGDGTQYLLPTEHATNALGRALRAGDPADVVVVSDDPVAKPEALEDPLCVMRHGVVVSLSPSLAVAD